VKSDSYSARSDCDSVKGDGYSAGAERFSVKGEWYAADLTHTRLRLTCTRQKCDARGRLVHVVGRGCTAFGQAITLSGTMCNVVGGGATLRGHGDTSAAAPRTNPVRR
jgi:hypothetical protein